MKYRRALLLAESRKDAASALSLLRRFAPQLEHLLVVLPEPATTFAWLYSERSSKRERRLSLLVRAVRDAAAGVAPSIDVQLIPELENEALAALCGAQDADLLAFGSPSFKSASLLLAQPRQPPTAVLWASGKPDAGPIEHVGCVTFDGRSRAAIGAFLRDHGDRSLRVAWLSASAPPSDVLAAVLEVSGIKATVETSSPGDASSWLPWLNEWARDRPLDLLVFAHVPVPAALLAGALRTAPVLLVPPLLALRPSGQPAIDVADLIDDGGSIRARVDQLSTFGDLPPAPDQRLAFVAGGRIVFTVMTSAGEALLPAGLDFTFLGLFRMGDDAAEAREDARQQNAAEAREDAREQNDVEAREDARERNVVEPLVAIERRIALVRPGAQPLVLFEAELADDALRELRELCAASGHQLLAVRLRPTRSCRSIRERLRSMSITPVVLDARAVLDEGDAPDVSEPLDAVRLARVGAKLQRSGFPVTAFVHRGPVHPFLAGLTAVRESELASDPTWLERPLAPQDIARAANALLSPAIDGNRIELELDNHTARSWLLDAIAQSQQTLHLQVYMGQDDDVGRQVEEALAAAGARGVRVRVLIDSLHGLYGSFRAHNPVFERLATRPGVELRTFAPITELPSLVDLKQRDHRKLVVADGRLALIGGRNLSHEYYVGFDEVALTSTSLWREVPWLDAGARVEGPAVAALSSSFLEAWIETGGAPFPVVTPPPIGTAAARVVVHRGLRDARTLEAYLELIDSARSHVYVVNGFPLLLELQHALLRARRRGLRVRCLSGHVTPTHDGEPFVGPWGAARHAATELVHSRLDPIAAAEGEVYLFAQHRLPGWAPGLGTVHPHVHAKVMSVDGLRCAVGSANMDITAAYWESELMLIVEDAALTAAFEARIDALIAGSVQMTREDPGWRELAKRRAWMRHWPGTLSL